jgi:sodium/potassium/calcium exchanger 6
MSVVWIYIAANELVAVLEAVGQILGISSAIMGLTVLAWGNSVSDMISNSIISKKSFPQSKFCKCSSNQS